MPYFIRVDSGSLIPIKNKTKLSKRVKYYERLYPDSKVVALEIKSKLEFYRGNYEIL